jgi:hypothetical protein
VSKVTILGFDKNQKNGKELKHSDSWSYSRYAAYNECPAKFAFKFLIGIEEPQNEAMARGNRIHKLADKYVMAEIPPGVPEELQKFEPLFDMAREDGKFFTEQQWGFTKRWEVTGYMVFKDGPTKTFLRNIVDLGRYYDDDNHMLIVDHKTGKLYDTNEDQVELFALSAMCRFPAVKTVEARLWYLDSGDEVIREFDTSQKKYLQQKWDAAIEPMFNDRIYAPRKNKWCNRCFYSKYNGGPCSVA